MLAGSESIPRPARSMILTGMANFCKNEDCPTSQELLDFSLGDQSPGSAKKINSHLSSCEFCSAEVDFYSHYPQSVEDELQETAGQIPLPLFELAEALLKIRNSDPNSLNVLLEENGELVIDQA